MRITGIFLGFAYVAFASADADSVPIDVNRCLSAFAALAPIHANFTVHYQMCGVLEFCHTARSASSYGMVDVLLCQPLSAGLVEFEQRSERELPPSRHIYIIVVSRLHRSFASGFM